ELKFYEQRAGLFFEYSAKTNIDSASYVAIQSRYADIQNRNFQAAQDYKLATNQVKRLLFVTDNIAPTDTTLEMYAINPKTSGPDKFYPATHIQLYDQTIQLSKWEANYERAKLFPEITAGYFNQEIEHINGLEGFMVGLSVPLWFFPQKTKIRQAIINRDIAKNERDYNQFELELRIENLKIELDKLFVQISFFTENVLKQADQQEQSVISRYKSNTIPVLEMFDQLNPIYSKRLEFLTILKHYNQLAVELEFLIR
ncbi:MAG TPA: TolC family protein, partial [Bacteroidales bacterium]|nr:TolC family protein [Bacteroidales bacterium]